MDYLTVLLSLQLVVTLTSAVNIPQTTLTDLDLSGCGSTKGCFRDPTGCSGADCKYAATWKKNGNDRVDFEMQGTLSGSQRYITLGLSKDNKMGDDSVMDCIYTASGNQPIIIQMSYNPGESNSVVGTGGLVQSSLEGYYVNGKIICRFTKAIQSSNGRVFNLDKDYIVMMAKGNIAGSTKLDHQSAFTKSSGKVNVASGNTNDISGSGDAFVKTHGILMILAWMICVSFATIMPRYFKGMWPGKKWCGKDIWIMIHYPVMVSGVILNGLGFIIIFISVKGYASYASLPSSAHPPLGIITTILALVNPIMAAFRPDPGSPKRPIFNWSHFVVGRLGHILSFATICVGIVMSKSNMPIWCLWVMIIFIVFHIVIEILLALYTYVLPRTKKVECDDIGMQQKEGSEQALASSNPNPNGKVKTILCIIHLAGCVIFSVVLIIPLAIA